ncbi:anoctamin-2b [Odontesthes bonariensis]|uniref:anoctamin-2b n=1 Tax=Odontesthes bonariensis TaxID=219752 RepID=UPI003F5820C7
MQIFPNEDKIPVVGSTSSPQADREGLYFCDGQRKVDYVLVFHHRRHSSIRYPIGSTTSQDQLSVVSNGNFPQTVGADAVSGRGGAILLGEAANAGEVFMEIGNAKGSDPMEPADHEMHLIRQEFEANLLEAGLEIERDREVKTYGPSFTRVHAPWPVLCREAEFLKIKVPTKASYELKEESGFGSSMSTVWRKLNQPFQPKVSHQDHGSTKFLSHCFSRDKLHLYNITSKDTFFDNATRGRMVYEILRRTVCVRTCQTIGISTLIAKGVYDAAFPLHDGDYKVIGHLEERNDRQVLYEEWARYSAFYKFQPIDLVRKYFGEKIGLYFAWLGVYTQLLIPASIVGIIVFCYGVATVDTNIPSLEMCDEHLNFTMCPLCDGACDFWHLSTACSTARASHLFDNPATVFFAIFMSLWAVLFLEHWKRRQISLSFSWDLTGIEEDEEHPRPRYETILLQKKQRKQKNKKKKKKSEPEKQEDGTVTGKDRWRQKLLSAMAAGIPAAEEKLTWKDRLPGYFINVSSILFMFGLTFAAVFGVIIYRITVSALIAMSPDPGIKSNVRVTVTATAVIINLVVILILDEIYGTVALRLTELEIPKTETNFEERLILKAFLLKFMNAYAPIFYVAFFKGRFAGRPGNYVYVFNDYRMEECAPGGCLIELCIQLSIIMLGKQLIQNNIFEIGIPKLKKLIRTLKEKDSPKEKDEERPPQQWSLDHALAPFEGLTPEYMEMRDELNYCLYTNTTSAQHLRSESLPEDSEDSAEMDAVEDTEPSQVQRAKMRHRAGCPQRAAGRVESPVSVLYACVFCFRYKDYREPPWSQDAYQFSKQYWSVLAARLAFVILFQNLVMFLSLMVAWVIPDVPKTIVEQLKREKKLLVNVFLQEEKEKFQLIQSLFVKDATLHSKSQVADPGQAFPILGRYSTLPSGPTSGDGGGGPRARCRAASFSQFSGKISSSPENTNSKHTAV